MSKISPWCFAAVNVMLPAECPGCRGEPGLNLARLCGQCRSLFQGLPRFVDVGAPVAGAWALSVHKEAAASAVRWAKYRPDPLLIDALGTLLGEAAVGRLPRVDSVVPVPVHRRRRLERGFDQGERLARGVAAALGRPMHRSLRRVRQRALAGTALTQRALLARGAFRCGESVPRRVLLVDDVVTTGATARACCRELLSAGASRVWVLSLTAARAVR